MTSVLVLHELWASADLHHLSILFESRLQRSVLHVSDSTLSVLPMSGVLVMSLLLSC